MGIYEFGEYVEVHPTFLYESIATFTLFIVLMILQKKRKFPGQLTYVYFMGYGLARAIIEGLRTDSLMLGNIRISQLVSMFLFAMGMGVYIRNNKRK